eukprot:7509836-Prorocentrum_lima.AAC.1
MTSSLVGSEMCIRDSNSTEACSTLGGVRGAACTWVSCCCVDIASSIDQFCLLYTSDAADDM